MGRVVEWWIDRKRTLLEGEGLWALPISHVQGFRPVGGYLVGTSTTLEFVPNRFEVLVGGSGWTAPLTDIEHVKLGARRLDIVTGGGRRTLRTFRPKAVRQHLGHLLAPSAG